jgi:hypothetical protein
VSALNAGTERRPWQKRRRKEERKQIRKKKKEEWVRKRR